MYINYATGNFKEQQDYAIKMALKKGGFDTAKGFTEKDIDKWFKEQNNSLLSSKTGAGYWLWKPYCICKALNEIKLGDYLLYADSGSFLIKNIDVVLDEIKKYDQDVIAFELPLIESQWTKNELFSTMNCDDDKYTSSNQINGSFHLIRKSEKSVSFYNELLSLSCDERNITNRNFSNITQRSDYIEHRYDQSIFSLLYKKYNFRPFKDPSQFGKYPERYTGTLEHRGVLDRLYISESGVKYRYNYYPENFGVAIFHNRTRNPRVSLFKFRLKEVLINLGLCKDTL